ncbi:hypothetical protein PIB30_030589 [Stylosanthes scabra]|uniref:Uncharacterized protein n=1 Tax=Stylosanthes scabra TaxID=79078 RepID=A0ABU6UBG2_9FABA|nr:hypothetical protein [Stylosanthes scabra]
MSILANTEPIVTNQSNSKHAASSPLSLQREDALQAVIAILGNPRGSDSTTTASFTSSHRATIATYTASRAILAVETKQFR